ncbi:MAG: hypothetical protein HY553_02885 [Elusimicrobia bacterium]|nr:hypothetical protein [Elusimicrobiota bacterium]
MSRTLLLAAAASFFLAAHAAAALKKPVRAAGEAADPERGEGALVPADTELMDVPTAAILDYGGYSSRTRFFSNGGVMEWLSFGVFQRLNIGASMNVDRLIGTSSPVQLTRPDLQVKFRFYDGDRVIPAAVIGFDGQGYLYNRKDLRYDQRQRGLYLVGSQEIGVPGLHANAGMNISDFNSNSIFGFMAMDYNVRDKVLLMLEWDNVHNFVESRINMGFRIYVTPSFHLDFGVRSVGQGGHFSNGVSRAAERVVNFKYSGSF